MSAEAGIASDLWLVVEDDDNDFLLFRRACARALNPQPLVHRENDGVAAKNFLSQHGETPRVIVSDLKMPNMDGLEFLQWVRNQSALRQVRFIMLSSSDAEKDVNAARTFGVDDYQVKPSGLGDLTRLVQELETPGGGQESP
jgi:CheY-like chemotaxis protein